MNKVTLRALALIALTSASAPAALAADMPGGSSGRGYGSGGVVAVPAPIPYQETYKWYIRGDFGATLGRSGDVSVTGGPVTVDDISDWGNKGLFSIGFGRYITPTLRAEFTADFRKELSISRGDHLATWSSPTVTVQNDGTVIRTGQNDYDVYVSERSNYTNTTLMASGVWDLNRGGKINPFFGVGVGVAFHQLNRNGTNTYSCTGGVINTTNMGPPVTNATVAGCTNEEGILEANYIVSNSTSELGIGLAAAAQIGVSVELSKRVHLDTSYRALWQSGKVIATFSSPAGSNTLKIGDRFEHEVRTGIRWDLW